MECVPVDVRKLVLAYLECNNYLNALESSKYWYIAKDKNMYKEKQLEYRKMLRDRKIDARLKENVDGLKVHLNKQDIEEDEDDPTWSVIGPMIAANPDTRDNLLSLLNNENFKELMKEVIGLSVDGEENNEGFMKVVDKFKQMEKDKLFDILK